MERPIAVMTEHAWNSLQAFAADN